MNFDPRLYVEIVPSDNDNGRSPHPHPILDGRFDAGYAYKVLGLYNPAGTSECYLMLSNTRREIWFIPQRHTRAFARLDGDDLSVPKEPVGGAAVAEHTGERAANRAAAVTSLRRGRQSRAP